MSLWPVLLIVVTSLLFFLPLVPGIIELMRPTDIKPLKVAQDYDINPYHFADGFRSFMKAKFGDIRSPANLEGKLDNGTRYQLIGETGKPGLDESHSHTKVILSAHPLLLPAGELFESEVYSEKAIATGERSHYRAIMSDDAIRFGEQCTVLRWAHSDGTMTVGRGSQLFGRATSKTAIVLGDNVQFERLHAPRITTLTAGPARSDTPAPRLMPVDDLSGIKLQSESRVILHGALDFPASHLFEGDIITGTTAVIGDYSHIKGSIKVNAHEDVSYHLQKAGIMPRTETKPGNCAIGNYVRIDGTILSTMDMTIGQHCQIFGPVIAEGILIIGAGTVIGTPENPTTITAGQIIMESGCVLHGTLWATGTGGAVRPALQSETAA